MDNLVLLVASRLSSCSSSIMSSTSRTKDQSIYSRKLGPSLDPVTTRSDKHACGEPMLTDHDKQATGNREPSKRDERGRSNAWHSCLVTALLSTQEDLVLAHSSERANSDSEGEPKKTKNGSIVLMLTSAKKKRSILRPEKYGDLTKTEHKILNEGCESRNNHRYAFVVQDLATQLRVKPKLHRRRRRIYESSYGRRRSQKVIHTYNVLEFGKYCEELSWNHRTITLYRSETSGTAEGAVRRAQEETSAVFFAIWIGC